MNNYEKILDYFEIIENDNPLLKTIDIELEKYLFEYLGALLKSNIFTIDEILFIMDRLVDNLTSVEQKSGIGIYGKYDNKKIIINKDLDEKKKKLYFFHELTHCLKTVNVDGKEICGLDNGEDGSLLEEATTQMMAEKLFNISENSSHYERVQNGVVRGLNGLSINSELDQYQLFGCISKQLCISLGEDDEKQLLRTSFNLEKNEKTGQIKNTNGFNIIKNKCKKLYRDKTTDLFDYFQSVYNYDKWIIGGYMMNNGNIATENEKNKFLEDYYYSIIGVEKLMASVAKESNNKRKFDYYVPSLYTGEKLIDTSETIHRGV